MPCSSSSEFITASSLDWGAGLTDKFLGNLLNLYFSFVGVSELLRAVISKD